MNILALDLATKTGYCTGRDGEHGTSGVQTFDVRRGESPGMRFLRLSAWLREIEKLTGKLDLIAYEQAHHRGGAATQCAVGMVTHVLSFAAEKGIDTMPVHTATLKKFATGGGKADKSAMIIRARELGYAPIDDNEADAIMLYLYSVDSLNVK